MINLSLNELKLIAENRSVEGYENKSKENLIKMLREPRSIINLSKKKIKEIEKDFPELRHKFSKSESSKFRKGFYDIKIQRNLSTPEIKEIEKNLIELEKSLYDFKKQHNYHDNEYKGIRGIKRLLNQFDKYYFKLIKTINSFISKSNYIEYKSKGGKDKNLSPNEHLNMIRPYLSDMINDHKTPMDLKVQSRNEVIDYETQLGEWKMPLTMRINFISSKDSEETCTMHTKSSNVEIMMDSETDDITDELFQSLSQRYQEGLGESMRGSAFVFNNFDLLHYHIQNISLNRGGSYVDSPKLLKNKKAIINPKNNDDNCFQYALTIALNHQSIKNVPQRISKIKPLLINMIGRT